MANRHKAFKKGGKVAVASGNKDVIKEAKERSTGGEIGKVAGRMSGGRLDKPCRKNVGGAALSAGNKDVVGEAKATGKSPFSSAGGGSASNSPFSKAKG